MLSLVSCGGGNEAEFVDESTRSVVAQLSRPPVILARAEAALVAECLSKAGFRYVPHENSSGMPIPTEGRLGGLGAPLRLQTARQNGYGTLIERIPEDATDDPNLAQEQYLATLSETKQSEYWELLDPSDSPQERIRLESGIAVSAATTGCAAEARKRIYGSVRAFLEIHNFFNELTGRRSEVDEDDRVKHAVEAYSACMREAGYEVVDASDARYQANQEFGRTRKLSDPVTVEERSMAVADATCQETSALNRAMDDAFIDVMSTWINDREATIMALKDTLEDASSRAEAILAETQY